MYSIYIYVENLDDLHLEFEIRLCSRLALAKFQAHKIAL